MRGGQTSFCRFCHSVSGVLWTNILVNASKAIRLQNIISCVMYCTVGVWNPDTWNPESAKIRTGFCLAQVTEIRMQYYVRQSWVLVKPTCVMNNFLQWTAEIRTHSDFGQTTLVRQQFMFKCNSVQNPNDFVQISNVRTIDRMSVWAFGFWTFLLS